MQMSSLKSSKTIHTQIYLFFPLSLIHTHTHTHTYISTHTLGEKGFYVLKGKLFVSSACLTVGDMRPIVRFNKTLTGAEIGFLQCNVLHELETSEATWCQQKQGEYGMCTDGIATSVSHWAKPSAEGVCFVLNLVKTKIPLCPRN